MDNIFVFVLVLSYFAIPPKYQHRVLFYGILGALVFRAVFIALGSVLMQIHWIVLLFGAFLIFTGIKMMFAPEKGLEPEKNPVIRLFRRFVPVAPEFHGQRFFVRLNGVLHATPLFITLLFVEVTDIIFAADVPRRGVDPAVRGGEFLVRGASRLAAAIGLSPLVIGARWLVDGAVAMAQALGLSELVIGLTIVAAGTSLPEVATSTVASLRGERDIAVGNIVGSNVYDSLAGIGLAGILVPDGIQVRAAALKFDLPVMLAVALACLPIFFTGNTIARWEGGFFLGCYVAYALYLILGAAQHEALPAFSAIMLAFVLPLTAVTLLIVTVRAVRATRPSRLA